MSHQSDAQAVSAAENWMRYILGGQLSNLRGFFEPGKVSTLSWEEYAKVYQELDAAIKHIDAAHEEIIRIQLARKIT